MKHRIIELPPALAGGCKFIMVMALAKMIAILVKANSIFTSS